MLVVIVTSNVEYVGYIHVRVHVHIITLTTKKKS